MAGLRHWYIGQLVTAQEMRGGDTALEQGIFDMATDLGFVGLIDGGAVVEHAGTPNMTVDVAALLARSPLGERIRVAGTAVVNCAFDYLTQPTAVTVPGNSRFVDVYVVFDRVGSDPRIDATNTTVYFVQEESFAFEIHQGAEAPSPAAPIGPSDGVLLARITRTFGQTSIVNADIDTAVKESVVKISSNAITIEAGTFTDALQLLLDELVTHIDGAGAHPASAVTYAGGSAWANGTTNPSTTVEVQLDKFVTDLAATTSGNSGLHKIGAANSSAWADGTAYVAGNAFARVDGIITSLASGTTSSSGARKVGIEARSNWLGGRTNPAITSGGGTWAAIEKIISDLGATNSTDDGMERIGGAARTGSVESLASGSAASQAVELLGFIDARARKTAAETITGAWEFSNTLTGDLVVAGDVGGARLRAVALEEAISGTSKVLTAATGTYIFNASGIPLAQFRLGLPTVSSGNPIVSIRGKLLPGSAKVYVCNAADVGGVPSNYYEYWDGSVSTAPITITLQWSGGRWHVIGKSGAGLTGGAGTYAT